jgi:hypothetical protein
MKTFALLLSVLLFAALPVHAQSRGASTGTGTSGSNTGNNGSNTNNQNNNQNNNNNGNTNANTTASNPRYWQATFASGGHYMVRLDHIACASKQIYVSDGAARVVEVNIGADNAIVARFYFLEPVGKDSPIAAGQVLIDRATDVAKTVAAKVSPSAAQLQVVKNYPASTHAHTVEFVLQDEATINSLYSSLMQSISTGKGMTWNEAGSSAQTNAPANN